MEWNWRFIVPDWLLHAFEEHEYRHQVLMDEKEELADDGSLPG